jgi:hypothetical protein
VRKRLDLDQAHFKVLGLSSVEVKVICEFTHVYEEVQDIRVLKEGVILELGEYARAWLCKVGEDRQLERVKKVDRWKGWEKVIADRWMIDERAKEMVVKEIGSG